MTDTLSRPRPLPLDELSEVLAKKLTDRDGHQHCIVRTPRFTSQSETVSQTVSRIREIHEGCSPIVLDVRHAVELSWTTSNAPDQDDELRRLYGRLLADLSGSRATQRIAPGREPLREFDKHLRDRLASLPEEHRILFLDGLEAILEMQSAAPHGLMTYLRQLLRRSFTSKGPYKSLRLCFVGALKPQEVAKVLGAPNNYDEGYEAAATFALLIPDPRALTKIMKHVSDAFDEHGGQSAHQGLALTLWGMSGGRPALAQQLFDEAKNLASENGDVLSDETIAFAAARTVRSKCEGRAKRYTLVRGDFSDGDLVSVFQRLLDGPVEIEAGSDAEEQNEIDERACLALEALGVASRIEPVSNRQRWMLGPDIEVRVFVDWLIQRPQRAQLRALEEYHRAPRGTYGRTLWKRVLDKNEISGWTFSQTLAEAAIDVEGSYAEYKRRAAFGMILAGVAFVGVAVLAYNTISVRDQQLLQAAKPAVDSAKQLETRQTASKMVEDATKTAKKTEAEAERAEELAKKASDAAEEANRRSATQYNLLLASTADGILESKRRFQEAFNKATEARAKAALARKQAIEAKAAGQRAEREKQLANNKLELAKRSESEALIKARQAEASQLDAAERAELAAAALGVEQADRKRAEKRITELLSDLEAAQKELAICSHDLTAKTAELNQCHNILQVVKSSQSLPEPEPEPPPAAP